MSDGVTIYGIAKSHGLASLNGRHGTLIGSAGAMVIVQLDDAPEIAEVPEICAVPDRYLIAT